MEIVYSGVNIEALSVGLNVGYILRHTRFEKSSGSSPEWSVGSLA